MKSVKCPECGHSFSPASAASDKSNPAKWLRAVVELAKRYHQQHGRRMKTTEIAAKLDINQGYASNLLNISERVEPSIVERWVKSYERGDAQVSANAMRALGAHVERSKQLAEYERLVERANLKKRQTRQKHQVSRRRVSVG